MTKPNKIFGIVISCRSSGLCTGKNEKQKFKDS